ncbi:dTDP-4-dehydrorhamnose 3,5-epimerase [uncultured Winogradskyella sp.]|uniref:dTDP-4-dehydrorhamnose 3,5-epimerase n=1 Tax=uncultured Winogradskyella sp. TaxID=395353 RepID=UPI00260F6EA7|nr:dTDP-4-dehydrorhamnose 3,5-epimerase [uncultured Winogradskyella sp.]
MIVKKTKLKGCYLLKPKIFEDKRGYFIESFNRETFRNITGLDANFVQDNEAKSSKGVLRGLHYQRGEFAQAKLVRVIKGSVLDVAVDLRRNSSTFGEYEMVKISEENKLQFYIPRGFAHGYLALEDETIFSYKCDNFYKKEAEAGIIFDDPDLNINWNFPIDQLIISSKDLKLPKLKNTQL